MIAQVVPLHVVRKICCCQRHAHACQTHISASGLLRNWMTLMGSSDGHIQGPIPDSFVKCIAVTGNANIFATDCDSTLYEVVPHNAFLLPMLSISRVLHFGLDPRTRMPFLGLEAYNVVCYASDGRDQRAVSLRVMLWTGILRKVWVRKYMAQNIQ